MKHAEFRIYGEVKGHIWLPDIECTKEFNVRFSREQKPFGIQATRLRDALLHITRDGDFQSCAIDWAVLEIRNRREHKEEVFSYPLFGNDGNGDCYAKNN